MAQAKQIVAALTQCVNCNKVHESDPLFDGVCSDACEYELQLIREDDVPGSLRYEDEC